MFRIERESVQLSTGKARAETVYGVTSLGPDAAPPGRLMALIRGHWTVENRSHYVRDVTFDEDRSQIRRGAQQMACLRNLAISLLRLSGYESVAEGIRACMWRPAMAMTIIGAKCP